MSALPESLPPPRTGPGPALPETACAAWNALPAPLVLLDRQAQRVFVNTAFAALRARGEGVEGVVPALFEPATWDALALHLQGTEAFEAVLVPAGPASAGWSLQGQWDEALARWVCLLRPGSGANGARADLFGLLVDHVPALIASYDAHTMRCLFANAQYARTFGRSPQQIVGLPMSEIVGTEVARQIQPQVDGVLHEGRPAFYERRITGADGRPMWLEVHLLPHFGADGQVVACFVLISDITRHRLADQAVRESEERLAKFMQASVEGIVFHQGGLITDANPPALALIGYALEEIVGRPTLDFVAPDEVAQVAAALASGDETRYESALVDKAGERIPVEFIVRTLQRGGERLRMTIVRDLRDRRAAQARIHQLAHHDALTELPNRVAFMQRIDQLMAQARLECDELALLFIDLDHFKRVNDSLGHQVGDTLLQTVAQRIGSVLRATDVVARFGGDEFMVLVGGGPRREDVADVARKLLAAIEAPLQAEAGRLISVTPSIGIAMFPDDGATPAELIRHADTAMYRAKARGRATYQFFEPALAREAYAALVLEGELAHALERGEFVLHYQPQVRASDGALVGAEALIRWQHPERGLLLPQHFISLAEQQRLMLPIGAWVLREAAQTARHWHDSGLCDVPIAVNLSAMQFQGPDFVASVHDALEDAGLPGHLLELELTERMLMDELPEVNTKLAQLKALGIRLSVDDFGTGYSSLGQLKSLPIDKMKIDRSFVSDLPEALDSVAIARAVIQMARSLGIAVIAEGVETEAQRAFLAGEHCDELQGFAISRPLGAEAFGRWVAGGERGGAAHEPAVQPY